MKIGILTFHRAYNYGAIIQAYALSKKINELYGNCEIIDYRPEIMEDQYHRTINPRASWKAKIKSIISYPKASKRSAKIKNFIECYLPVSCKSYNLQDAAGIADDFEKIVVGSDQVWAPRITGNDEVFFLKNIGKMPQKTTYAASMGNACFDEKIMDAHIDDIRQFSHILVREESLKEALKRRKVESDVVLDPSLLLTGEEWKKSLNLKTDKKNQGYIMLYTVGVPNKLIDYVKAYARRQNLPVVMIGSEYKKLSGVKQSIDSGIEDFLECIMNARYVFTNSFHCTVFSILFHKDFYVELNGKSGFNNRINDLLRAVGLTDRDITGLTANQHNIETNWDEVEDVLVTLRNRSIELLKKGVMNE